MASQGPLSPSVGDNNASIGAYAWGGTGSIFTSNDVRAFASDVGAGTSNYLTATSFGFTIPVGSRIDGILVEIEKSSNVDSGSDYVVDSTVKLIKADGTIAGTNKADTSTHWPTTDAYISYGGSGDTWGLEWSDGNIDSVNFGVAIAANTNSGGSTGRVDHIRITVYYTENATTTSTSSSTSSTSSSTSSTSTSISSTSASTSSTSSSISVSTSSSTSTSLTALSINVTPRAFIRIRR